MSLWNNNNANNKTRNKEKIAIDRQINYNVQQYM